MGGFVLLSSGAGTEARALQMRELDTASEPQSSCLVSIWFLLFVFLRQDQTTIALAGLDSCGLLVVYFPCQACLLLVCWDQRREPP